jgi:hypothetical protein
MDNLWLVNAAENDLEMLFLRNGRLPEGLNSNVGLRSFLLGDLRRRVRQRSHDRRRRNS